MRLELIPNDLFDRVVGLAHHALNVLRTQIGGHDDHCIAEIDRTTLSIGQTTIVEHLQQHVEDIRVGFFHLIQQDHAVGLATNRFGQVATLLIANIAGRRTDETCHRVFFHELAHVDTNQVLVRIE